MASILSSITGSSSSSATLEEILTRAANATSPNDVQSLSTYLKASAKDATLANLIPGTPPQDPLNLLNPTTNTLGYLYVLSARMASKTATPVPLPLLMAFVQNFDPMQAQLAPERMVILAKSIWKRAEVNNQPAAAVLPLKHILSRYPHDRSLTPIHPIFAMACVTACAATQALPILSNPITAVHVASLNPPGSKEASEHCLTYQDALQFYYLGGVLLALLKKWTLAEEYFEICATAPSQSQQSASALQLEALKKLVIVQMIVYGKVSPLPKYITPPLLRLLKSSAYSQLIKAYPAKWSPSDSEAKAFQADGNLGLVRQALAKAVSWRIRELTNTYVALGLEDLCQMANVDVNEGRAVLLGMIEDGALNASISTAEGSQTQTVNFQSSQEDIPSGVDMQLLLADAQKQASQIAQLEREMMRNKEFLYKAIKTGREEYGEDSMELYNSRSPQDWDEMTF